MVRWLGCVLLLRELPLASPLALTAPRFGGASRILLHLPGCVREGEVKRGAQRRKDPDDGRAGRLMANSLGLRQFSQEQWDDKGEKS